MTRNELITENSRNILNHLKQGVLLIGSDFVVNYANPFAVELLEQALVGQNIVTLLCEVDSSFCQTTMDEIVKEPDKMERIVLASKVHISLQMVPSNSEHYAYIMYLQNVTREKELEGVIASIRSDAANFKRMAKVGHWELLLDQNILIWSDEVYDMFGVDKHKGPLSYEEFLQRVHPDDRAYVDREYSASLKHHTNYDIVHRVIIDGQLKYLREKSFTYFEDDIPVRSTGLVQDVTVEMLEKRRAEKDREALIHAQSAIFISMIEMAGMKDFETGKHMYRTQLYISALAKELNRMRITSFEESYIEILQALAPLHDIGKAGIPDSILKKLGTLSDEEFTVMKKHPGLGFEIIDRVRKEANDQDNEWLKIGASLVLHHHERWDGKGYPNGLKGDDIPIEGQMMSLVDAYDAMRSFRTYKDEIPHDQVVEIIRKERGKQFSPVVVEAFMNIEETFLEYSQNFHDEDRQ